jgi:uncharacterized protein YkwD
MWLQWKVRLVPVALMLFVLLAPARHVLAYGEAVGGFPNWAEYVLLEWMNRARSDPQADLAGCTTATCAEKSCYATASPPRYLNAVLEHSARFHAAHMLTNNYFSHPSQCTLFAAIAALYPASCTGSAVCSCTQGALVGNDTLWTDPFTRMDYFGANMGSSGQSEIIAAGGVGPSATFYNAWMYEKTSDNTCGEHANGDNGHRYILLHDGFGELAGAGYLTNSGGFAGIYGSYATMDFSGDSPIAPKLPSGAHYPQQAASVDAWANWYDNAAPQVNKINVDGVCSDMALTRGTATNGAWHATLNGVGTGCHHYYFAFKDSAGKDVLFPGVGSLTIGDGGTQCPAYSAVTPPSCGGFDRIFASQFSL